MKRPVQQQSSWIVVVCEFFLTFLTIFLLEGYEILHFRPHSDLFLTESVYLCFAMIQHAAVLDTEMLENNIIAFLLLLSSSQKDGGYAALQSMLAYSSSAASEPLQWLQTPLSKTRDPTLKPTQQ